MRKILFHSSAFEEYSDWAKNDKKVFGKLTRIIKETAREPFSGLGKPEALKSELNGYWSRRITHKDRLVYKATDEHIIIISCKYHY